MGTPLANIILLLALICISGISAENATESKPPPPETTNNATKPTETAVKPEGRGLDINAQDGPGSANRPSPYGPISPDGPSTPNGDWSPYGPFGKPSASAAGQNAQNSAQSQSSDQSGQVSGQNGQVLPSQNLASLQNRVQSAQASQNSAQSSSQGQGAANIVPGAQYGSGGQVNPSANQIVPNGPNNNNNNNMNKNNMNNNIIRSEKQTFTKSSQQSQSSQSSKYEAFVTFGSRNNRDRDDDDDRFYSDSRSEESWRDRQFRKDQRYMRNKCRNKTYVINSVHDIKRHKAHLNCMFRKGFVPSKVPEGPWDGTLIKMLSTDIFNHFGDFIWQGKLALRASCNGKASYIGWNNVMNNPKFPFTIRIGQLDEPLAKGEREDPGDSLVLDYTRDFSRICPEFKWITSSKRTPIRNIFKVDQSFDVMRIVGQKRDGSQIYLGKMYMREPFGEKRIRSWAYFAVTNYDPDVTPVANTFSDQDYQ